MTGTRRMQKDILYCNFDEYYIKFKKIVIKPLLSAQTENKQRGTKKNAEKLKEI